MQPRDPHTRSTPDSPTAGSAASEEADTLAGDPREARLAMIFAELMDQVQRGEEVDLGTACTQHPDFQEELRQLWGTVMVTQAVGREHQHVQPSQPGVMAPPLELPSQFGEYMLLEEIGRGGMGVVYHARHEASGKEYALKMILHGDQASATTQKRFHAEARAATALDHPNIIGIADVGQHEGRAYFCMERIEGETLAERLDRGPMPPRQTARIMMQVARAIDYAHSQGVLHRDLKPSNILIADEGNQPFVVDFGLARDVTAKESLTRTGSVLGTPAYMAPEQAAGARGQVGPVSDVYSLGAIMYHMLTGRPPFQAASPVDTVLMLLEQDPIMPRVLNRAADRQLEMIAMRCLQKPQDLRYDSAGALASDLERFLNQESVAAQQGRFGHVIASVMRDTHHANVMENWGKLWIWHSLALIIACTATQLMYWFGVTNRWAYEVLWMIGFGAWAMVFWYMRRRMGPVTFIERQIAHLWLGSIICIGAIFPFEAYLDLPVLRLAPILALVASMVFLVKASMLSGIFYIQAAALFLAAIAMAFFYDWALLIFGVVSAGCFFFAGVRYYRRSLP
jgi:serine/threonine-protein kinase